MFERLHHKSATAAVAAVLAALGVAGVAAAQSNGGSKPSRAHAAKATHHAKEAPGKERERPGTESGSETPGNDGPGGHADEPGNPNADHQFQGQE